MCVRSLGEALGWRRPWATSQFRESSRSSALTKKRWRSLPKENRLVVQHEPEVREKPGVMATMFNLTGNMLLRAGIAYLGQQAGKVFGDQAAHESNHQTANL